MVLTPSYPQEVFSARFSCGGVIHRGAARPVWGIRPPPVDNSLSFLIYKVGKLPPILDKRANYCYFLNKIIY